MDDDGDDGDDGGDDDDEATKKRAELQRSAQAWPCHLRKEVALIAAVRAVMITINVSNMTRIMP